MPAKSQPRMKSGRARPTNTQHGTAKSGRARDKHAKPSLKSKTRELPDLRAVLLSKFLEWRDHPSCCKEARVIFNELADTVDDISTKEMRWYRFVERRCADYPDKFCSLSLTMDETLDVLRSGTCKPMSATQYLTLVCAFWSIKNSILWMAKIRNGDQGELQEFTENLVNNRAFAFDSLREAGLVIRHIQPNSLVRLEWPEPSHPAAAAYLATVGTPLRLVSDR